MNLDTILSLYTSLGDKQYAGEAVSQLEHGWQCGCLAANADANKAMQLAAWLHDIGHLIADLPGSPTVNGVDDRHEHVGANAIAQIWGESVAEPVRLHVLAKRFLVTTKPEYRDKLSIDSLRSLELQGGVMTDTEVTDFRANTFGAQAVLIRVWDDLGKTEDPKNKITKKQQLELLSELMHSVPQIN